MVRHGSSGIGSRLVALAFLAVVTAVAPLRADDLATFRNQLATGEFAPARALAERQPNAALRDRLLAELALAQSFVGEKSASLATSALVLDDRSRTATFDRLRSEPRGGGVQPDFESLMELVTSTIAPTTWDDVGGAGAVRPFPGGVYVDAKGALVRAERKDADLEMTLARHERPTTPARSSARKSTLRKVSLPRLEREIQLRLAAGKPLDDEMLTLAGIERIQLVLVYPQTGDLVVAGPAGDWQLGLEDRVVSVETGRPVVRLDDLVMLLRHRGSADETRFGCSITPTQESLARTSAFAAASSRKPLPPNGREAWLAQLRGQLGAQGIEVYGIAADSRAAQVLVEADYRMKLVGIGLEDGVLGVTSYLDALAASTSANTPSPPMDVLRWWFTLDYDSVAAAPSGRAFELRGQGVRVLSENELLTALGERVHTGSADDRNQRFAHDFTTHFAALAAKYPVYAELQNIFDLALVATLIRTHGLAEQAGWHMPVFGDAERLPLPRGNAPKSVETVINHRVVNRTQILAVVSGGVSADPGKFADTAALETDADLSAVERKLAPTDVPRDAWWWD